ncbi:phage baseplate protein [Raoultibacter phocaeensis]|uniref:phage baseplate protein n=1 Tax=Raoultibacter phocaeensis TaxID=2479841 RepID=UPI00111B9CB3|nr:hypothetical protein [Raoultibacter phocaeensis]
MSVELVTGKGATDHVGAEDFGAYQAYTYGPDEYILHGCEATVIDSNTIRISEGDLLVQGRHVRVKGSEDVAIQSGIVGRNRKDLICVRYAKDQNGIEDAPISAIVGTPVEGEAVYPPTIEGDLLAGDVAADFPLFSVSISGLEVGVPVPCMKRTARYVGHIHSQVDIEDGAITAAKLDDSLLKRITDLEAAKLTKLDSYPIGSYYISHIATSPASLFGGSWTSITGRFLYANSSTAAGGSNTHTLTVNEMPSHTHNYTDYHMVVQQNSGLASLSCVSWSKMDYGIGVHPQNTGGNAAHNNMPAYQSVYAWRRTS